MSNPNDLVIIRRADVEAFKQEAIFGVFRRDAVEWDKLNALLSNAPVVSDNKDSVRHLWECLGTWSAYLATNWEDANLAPPSWLVEAITKATTPQQSQEQDELVKKAVTEALEEAAKEIDLMVNTYVKSGNKYQAATQASERCVNKARAAMSCAETIRALIKRNAVKEGE